MRQIALFALFLTLLSSQKSAHAEAARLPDTPHEQALPPSLTLDEALQLFRQRGLDLLIAEANVYSAEGDVRIAGAVPNPNFDVNVLRSFYGPGSTTGNGTGTFQQFETPWGFNVGLGDSNAIEDSLSGKRGLRLRVARAALEVARSGRKDAQRTLEFQVKQQYIAAVLARDSLDFALEVQKSNDQTFDLNQKRYTAGAINEADLAKVETAKLEADQAVDMAAQALRVAKVGLAFLLGVRGPVPEFKVDADLPKFVVPPQLQNVSSQALLDEARNNRPDLRSSALQHERATAGLRLAKRLIFPDLALNVQYTQQGSYGGLNEGGTIITGVQPPTLQFGITGTLPLFYQQEGEVRKAEADLRTQELLRAKTEAQVTSDVEVAYQNFVSSRSLVERMESRLLDRAKRARDLVQFQYLKGSASLLEFLDAQRTYISTNVEYLQDLANYWTAVFQLEQAVGTELRK